MVWVFVKTWNIVGWFHGNGTGARPFHIRSKKIICPKSVFLSNSSATKKNWFSSTAGQKPISSRLYFKKNRHNQKRLSLRCILRCRIHDYQKQKQNNICPTDSIHLNRIWNTWLPIKTIISLSSTIICNTSLKKQLERGMLEDIETSPDFFMWQNSERQSLLTRCRAPRWSIQAGGRDEASSLSFFDRRTLTQPMMHDHHQQLWQRQEM
jgi:hypothetical protein